MGLYNKVVAYTSYAAQSWASTSTSEKRDAIQLSTCGDRWDRRNVAKLCKAKNPHAHGLCTHNSCRTTLYTQLPLSVINGWQRSELSNMWWRSFCWLNFHTNKHTWQKFLFSQARTITGDGIENWHHLSRCWYHEHESSSGQCIEVILSQVFLHSIIRGLKIKNLKPRIYRRLWIKSNNLSLGLNY